ncbi:MAG: 3-deoxy-7-phosphoheptulonate synthase [Clostridiales bacterium]|nr:3-deoxy-7-phosphoheptulonate synthase [Candidatus Cacconaster stercorequi]
MVITVKKGTEEAALRMLAVRLRVKGIGIAKVENANNILLTLVGDTWQLDPDSFLELPYVEDVQRVTTPYHLASRRNHPESTVISLGEAQIGQDFCLIAGPCAVESLPQIVGVARRVKESGAQILRGGAFKPRTSPYTFPGLGEDGLQQLMEAKAQSGLPVVSEITEVSQLPLFENVDMIQVGARNMQNFDLLRELGKAQKPVLLKRGLSATIDELLLAAEYILDGGNQQVVLCERGIRTFSNNTRATLDISAIPVLKKATHLPVIVDPSHAAGRTELVTPLALAAVAAGADGLMVEVHDRPAAALSDGAQALNCEQFDQLAQQVSAILPHAWRQNG